MNWFYLTIPVAFVSLVVLFLIVFVRAPLNKLIKFLTIPCIVWFGLVLYYSQPKLMGWPSDAEPPNGSLILSWHVILPGPDKIGGIYFWVVQPQKESDKHFLLNPKELINYYENRSPKSYRIPYDEKRYLDLLEKQKHKEKIKGFLFYDKRKKGGILDKFKRGEEKEYKDDSGFKLIDPIELLSKERSDEV